MRIFRDWNFSIALVFMFLIGIILLATMALVTPFIQNMLGYPVLSSGYLLGTRGIGTFVAMFLVGRLSGKVDARLLIFIGLVLATVVALADGRLVARRSARRSPSIRSRKGFGLGFVFVPLNTIAFATPAGRTAHRRRGAVDADPQHRLVGRHLDRHRPADQHDHRCSTASSSSTSRRSTTRMRMPNASHAVGHGLPNLAMLEGIVTQQAAAMAYSNDFLLMTFVSLCAFPLLALIRSPKAAAAAVPRSGGACGDGLSDPRQASFGRFRR